jgi:hypothetical protein
MNAPATLPEVKEKDLREAMRIIGSRGGKKRAQSLTAEQRREAAQRAATARWGEKKDAPPVLSDAKCKTCGEPEDGGQFGWFDDADSLHCNRCGKDPRRQPRKAKR